MEACLADKMKQRPGKPTAGTKQQLLLWGHGPEDTGPWLREASAHRGGTHPQAEQGERVFLHRRASIVEGGVASEHRGRRCEWEQVCRDMAKGLPREGPESRVGATQGEEGPQCTRGRRWEKPCSCLTHKPS